MEADVWGVRISPPFLEFLDVKVGFTYRGTVTVKNISKTSKRLRINGPVSKLFKLSVANQDKPIAPGLMLTAVVEYIPEKDEDFRDRLILLADEDVIEIPLLAMCPSCYLEIETEVDFGFVVANSRLISKEIEISNHGSAPGVFKIYSVSNLPVKIQPPSGIVQPKTTQKIKFELTTDKATNFEEFVKVKLQDSEDVVIKIKADIVEQVLELLNTANQRIECVRFGAAYFGTSKLQQAVLYNNSPQAINWVAILQDDAEGADVGNDWDSSTDATLLEMRIRQKLDGIDIAMLISCFPNQGSLGPYEKTTVILHFSPIYNSVNEPKKQDYALFMKFEIVGSKESFIQETSRKYLMKKERGHNHVELALTGTGLPVILMATPAPPYDFKECYMGEQVDIQCSLQNQSLLLPVLYSSRKTANFSIFPSKGKINPGMQQDVVLSFVPHQAGTFKVNQLIDIFGPVALPSNNSVHLKSRPFHQISLSFTGVCKPTAKQMVAKFNPGIKSSFTNESGQFFEVNSEQLRNYNSSARMALLCATKTGIHTHRRSKSLEKNVLVSFPDDRATSIKQSSRNELYRTIFTKTLRYNYVDPDYAYTEEEDEQRKAHREYYAHFLKSLREQRLQKEKDREMGDVKGKDDLGMKSAAGIFPKKLLLGDIEVNQQVEVVKSTLLTTRRLAAIESRSTSRPVTDGLNVVPTTQEETEDCKMTLSAQQLHQIIIGPSVVDFGEVCLHSISSKPLNIVNNLPVHIWVQFEIDCLELQQTSPLSHVVPPMSRAFLPIIFETNDLGKFQRSVTYTINKNHVGHVLVLGQVVPVTLELSTQELILTPNSCFLAESGFRSTITLRNPQNHPAEFTWKPIITENGIAFSIRPATGSVDAYRELECEVVWHPSYYSPVDGEFDLIVHEGNTARLKCLAMLGSTSVEFTEKHVVFGSVAQNLTAIKTATLQNNGQNHAYFQVFDPNPLPGMTIIPSEGVVPVGGSLDLVLYFIPDAVMKFDTRVEVGIRNTKSSELRIGGSVEMPQVEIDVKNFRFPGVYSGSVQEIPFTLQNKTAVRARVEFDLSDHPEFAIKFIDCTGTCKGSNIFLLDMEENESLECSLVFSPREVAAYDFSLPVNINSAVAPSPPPSSLPKTPSIIEKHLVTPRPHTIAVTTPSRRIQATVLQPPLEVSKMELKFEVPAEFSNTELFPESINTQTFEMKNISQKEVSWMIDLTKENSYFDEGIFKIYQQAGTLQPDEKISITVCFCPRESGIYNLNVPIFINDDYIHPFRSITLSGVIKIPKIIFDPPSLILAPVPLETEVGAMISIIPSEYIRNCFVNVELPEIELEDGTNIKPFTLKFLSGQQIITLSNGKNKILTCQIIFKSSRPVSDVSDIVFIDEHQQRFVLSVVATADNCLLTAYPYLALHLSDQQIVLKSGCLNGVNSKQNTGEAILHPCYTPATHSRSTSSSSTFIVLSSTCDESFPESAEENLNGSVKKSDEIDQQGFKNIFGFPTFPMENTEEGHFFRMMLYAVQKWFSLFGWPKGPRPISIPESLRSGVCKNQSSGSSVRKSSFRSSRGKEANTVYDMLFHLSGQVLQGITTTQALPTDHTKRVLQLHWQHSSLITFLKAHGACLAYIRPEFLFEPDDFKHWNSIQSQLGQLQNKKANGMDKPGDISLTGIEDIYFESLSKRAWTDVLLQIYKVFVLSQIQTQGSNTLAGLEYMENIPKINPDPLSSNIYSTSERKLLTWLNLHYEKMRNTVWKKISKGEAPPGRWIINFDLDLLDGVVLATVLASYCPFLISTHLVNIYTNPTSLEQCLHNALLLVKAFHAINLEIDVQATDISDPNPIMMIMLCVYLYEKLPQYVPKKTIEFSVGLHCSSIRQVLLKNTSSKALVYTATIIGKESEDFVIVKGNTVTIAPRGQTNVTVEFTSRFLRPVESILLLTAKLSTGPHGGTLVFTLRSNITSITSSGVIKCSSPCYELNKCHVTTTNPFKKDGEFRVILLESKNSLAKVGPQEFLRNLDLKCSYPMSGSEFYSRDIASLDNNQDTSLGTTGQVNQLNEFFSPVESVFLECRGSANIEIHYLPFHLGKRYCSILFLNEKVGEFLYSVEGESTLPLPQPLIPVESSHIAHISGAGKGKRSEKPVLIFKCLMDSCLEEKLKIPLVNEAREKALAAVAQQRMSFVEFERRKITGTLQSSSVRAAMAALGLSETETRPVPATLENKYRSIDYKVEVSMPEHFKFPKKISIPVSTTSANSLKSTLLAVKTTEDAVEIPLIFHPKAPGRYPCQIVLHSSRDVRVHLIECVVNSEETEADLMFVTPALQTVTQDIPISNKTLQEWSIQGVIEGNGFYGPSVINVRAGEKVQYPLMFKPMCEGITLGKLTLQNYTDGTRQIFGLRGVGKKPLAFDHAVIDCRVGQLAQKVLMVPNFTQTRLICKVVSDLAIVSGFPFLELKPGQSTSYTISIDPRRRGKQTGVISFVAEDGEDQQPPHNKAVNQTDGKQAIQRLAGETFSALDDSKEVSHIYKVWFSLEIIAAPPPSVQIIAVKCPIHTKTTVDIPISNPSNETMHLDVLLRGAGLSGDSYLVLKPMEKVSYLVSYFSSFTGRATGSVIFQSDKVAEFWYELDLTTEKPLPTIFPPLQCELGKWTRHFIPLVNPTDETLQLQAFNSNPKHFSVELGPKKSLTMAPHSSANVPVHFCPSALGRANHKTSVSFKCRQVEEWKFLLSGIGLVPGTMEPLSISTSIGSHASVIVPFRNPTDHNVVVDVVLTDKEGSSSDFQETISSSVFSLPLQETYGIRLTPKGRLDIPVIFAPNSLQLSESAVVIQIKKENGDPWSCPQLNESDPKVQNAIIFGTEGSVIGIRWVYPIHGIPEAPLSKSSPAVIKCQARERIEEHIEVLLTGSVPGSSTDLKTKSETNNVQNIHIQDNIQNEVQVTDGSATAEEFYHEIQFQSDADKAQLEASVALCLQRKERDPNTGIVTLVFSIIFAPYKPYRCSAVLAVQCATGGKWKFPIQLIATEPKVDDVITIEAAGLNKTSMVGFRLTSQTRNPEPFTAYFMPASGQEFEVSPQSGELLPIDTAGTLITVSFTPSMYSKKHRATLVIQTSDMQWMYEIHGVQPRYVPPTSQASKTVTSVTMRTAPVKQRNFIRENLELTTTSVSSPIKGRPLVSRTK